MLLDELDPLARALIASMIIWAAVILATAYVLGPRFSDVLVILGGGAAAHVVVLGGLSRREGSTAERGST